jgi:hypothetical protein
MVCTQLCGKPPYPTLEKLGSNMAFQSLSEYDQDSVIEFLKSLRILEREQTAQSSMRICAASTSPALFLDWGQWYCCAIFMRSKLPELALGALR